MRFRLIFLNLWLYSLWAETPLPEKLKEILARSLQSSFTANFNLTASDGYTTSGKIYYQYPNKLHIRTSDGRIVATNGVYLWLYNPSTGVCAKQEVSGSSGGLLSLLNQYEIQERGSSYVLHNAQAYFEEIIITLNNQVLTSLKMRHREHILHFTFSQVELGSGIKASLFNYKPPAHVQVIENPLKP
ncbi:MAG: outer-membrane lipoprotein carrier protein LolA [Leptospiraceae bacterium]|nr:outer-membrane lipoprotein carrier protein LolA [Leptospiraceae bacterium]MDW8306491.1 outer-membrane lipoprotein carrier protein LolA [Leptospiraceae bacterium]